MKKGKKEKAKRFMYHIHQLMCPSKEKAELSIEVLGFGSKIDGNKFHSINDAGTIGIDILNKKIGSNHLVVISMWREIESPIYWKDKEIREVNILVQPVKGNKEAVGCDGYFILVETDSLYNFEEIMSAISYRILLDNPFIEEAKKSGFDQETHIGDQKNG